MVESDNINLNLRHTQPLSLQNESFINVAVIDASKDKKLKLDKEE